MQKLNLQVGQKVWTIQLGDCEVYDKSAKLIRCTNGVRSQTYYSNGLMFDFDTHPSLFTSNPFDQSVKSNDMVTLEKVSEPENKAELINALVNFLTKPEDSFAMIVRGYEDCNEIAETKLKRLLDSI